ncbi:MULTISPECIES: DUF1236 domain-containing protein [Bradyrhizobium]|uniref:DUF1236 domain-containing protein n=1 Tax=Bradyrhizobium TaxID=374 RepID=UPI0005770A20|nr:DUF1236 domain-containing protein [Bradyrhizobium japonicum]KMJ95105.1 hypothetical protein CF64_33075 [Bradyrhizobium japonicum]MBR0764745.1 DUF1236 domain-containing protein [Bradyrhizobium japonicum]MDH6178363.1 hypothetical protein [Bradyrhizobium japonicum]MYV87416.1 DUF1236 domain-containing protein [Bradyrhizobium japonicum]UQD70733.1 DUF1236 domain-containing protein [Bradyrhizobium japonicum]
MNKRLFLATTAAVAIATSAFAQSSPSTSSSSPSATQRQQDSTSTTSPSPSTTSPSSSSGSAQSNPSTNSAQTQSPSSTGQTTAGQSSNSGTNTTQAPASNNSTNQAQTNQPSSQTTTPANQAQTNPPSSTNNQTQSANPPASGTNQAQSPVGSGSTNTAQQPNNQQNTADRSSNTNVNASVNINDQQRTRIGASISHLNVQPLTNVNFSLSVGTVVPRDVRLQPLPADVVEIVPQYRGYNFVLVKDEIVIVEPSTYKIVTVLPYSGRSTASAPTRTEQRKVTFSDRDREVVRKHAKARPVERESRTTGSTVRREIRTGERLPESVEIEAFPEEVYRDAPSLREYRYINRDSRTYIVEPHERRVIEEID